MQYRSRVARPLTRWVKLRDKKLMAIDSKFPLDAYRRMQPKVTKRAGRLQSR